MQRFVVFVTKAGKRTSPLLTMEIVTDRDPQDDPRVKLYCKMHGMMVLGHCQYGIVGEPIDPDTIDQLARDFHRAIESAS